MQGTGGSLVLSNANNSYTGGVTVNGGTLYVTNTAAGSSATASGNVVVNNGGTVGGLGRIGGNLTVNSGGTLLAGRPYYSDDNGWRLALAQRHARDPTGGHAK